MTKRVCAVVNIFYPEHSFSDNLLKNAKYLDKIFIMNNGFIGDIKDSIDYSINKKIKILDQEKNYGVAKSFNNGIRESLKEKFDFIILLDQDSEITSSINSILNQVHANIGNKKMYFLNWNKSSFNNDSENFHIAQPRETISSGTILTKEIINDLGFMDETLCIDLVDTDYSLRAQSKEYELMITDKLIMEHEIGSPTNRTFFGMKIGSSGHNKKRIFFKSRNSVILYKRYFSCNHKSYSFLQDMFKLLILILILEPNKFTKIKYMMYGILWGISGRPLSDKLLQKLL